MAIIKCPECGHQVSDQANTCPSCGIGIAGKVTRCTNCGEVFFKAEGQCPHCHKPYVETGMTRQTPPPVPANGEIKYNSPTPPETPQDKPKKKRGYTALIISALIAAIICGVCFYYYQQGKREKEYEQFMSAKDSNDPEVLQNYLDMFKDAPQEHIDEINSRIESIRQSDKDWANALISNSKSALKGYLDAHPNSGHELEANHKIDSIDWAAAVAANSIESYQKYLDEHAEGEHADDADDKLQTIQNAQLSQDDVEEVKGVFNQYFNSLSNRDETGLISTVAGLLDSFLGKSNATKSDVISFIRKIYKPGIVGMSWKLNDDFHIDKLPVANSNGYMFTVRFSVDQMIEMVDPQENSIHTYNISAKVNRDLKISEFNMTRIINSGPVAE